jgi:hypothetical protein
MKECGKTEWMVLLCGVGLKIKITYNGLQLYLGWNFETLNFIL